MRGNRAGLEERVKLTHRYLAVAGMTLGIVFVVYLIPGVGRWAGFIGLAVALPLCAAALYRARTRDDGDGTGLALTGLGINLVCLVIAVPMALILAVVEGVVLTGSVGGAIALTATLWVVTALAALWVTRDN